MKTMIAFDLDGTLAESKQAIGDEMSLLLKRLLDVASVAVISGGDWPQFEKQVVGRMQPDAKLERLFIMPTTGTKLFRFQDGKWNAIYNDAFTPEERDQILTALNKAWDEAGFGGEQTWGERIEDRGSQITLSALGQQAPLEAKEHWDPKQEKRRKLQGILKTMIPDHSVNIGGATSVDITRAGIDKAYGMRRLCEHAGIAFENILFMGDAIYPGGNDDPVRAAGIDSIKVRDVADTSVAITAVVACLKE
ncbi:HAD-IIB family hydrolase [Sphingomonas immobilis]|uniref:phosphomannomutase n=1 Tax=Sphingomonas immobilis TaxID=3063997 RepID=A0ABT9A3G0_9SPHN|nr:HAD-IIB family hydrolase [Sphingomonas sp. CA1-15]MDO7844380.1 HAD-IIB family hydrolase [Sphingomonas sp. CA1-15]